jgi:hypothetical protein
MQDVATGETFSRQKRTSSTFLTVHYFNSFVPIAQQAGQAVVQDRLPLNLSLVLHLPCMPPPHFTSPLSLSF